MNSGRRWHGTTRKESRCSFPTSRFSGLANGTRRADVAAADGAARRYRRVLETICGVTDDSREVEQYRGTLGVTAEFVAARQGPVAQVQWNDNLGATFDNPGNVSAVRWGSGTMIGDDLFLTCGHLFDDDANGWMLPRTTPPATSSRRPRRRRTCT